MRLRGGHARRSFLTPAEKHASSCSCTKYWEHTFVTSRTAFSINSLIKKTNCGKCLGNELAASASSAATDSSTRGRRRDAEPPATVSRRTHFADEMHSSQLPLPGNRWAGPSPTTSWRLRSRPSPRRPLFNGKATPRIKFSSGCCKNNLDQRC